MDFDAKYYRRHCKKIEGKPKDLQILMERTYGSAIGVLEELEGLSYSSITRDIFYFSNGLQNRAFSKEFDGQLELAGGHPDEFVFHLHRFFNDLAARIRTQRLNREAAGFIGGIMRRQFGAAEIVSRNIINAFLILAQQMMEYLRPSKFAFETYVYGVDSWKGEFLVGPCPWPYDDVPVMEMRHQVTKGKTGRIAIRLDPGTSIFSSVEELTQVQRLHSNTSAILFPLINEYSFDIVPTHFYDSITLPLQEVFILGVPADLKERLRKRRRTLPANGVQFTIADPAKEATGILLKETMYQESIHLLYRFDTKNGSLSGFYDTNSGLFYSATQEATDHQPFETLQQMVLSLYASYVLDTLSIADIAILREKSPIIVQEYSRGGVLQDVYHKGAAVKDPSLYEDKETAIGCYIRRLPAGMTASADAQAMAAKHGYELKAGETFVQSFSKRVAVRKREKQ